jgi:membrane protease YdiL (CAAX protease family)
MNKERTRFAVIAILFFLVATNVHDILRYAGLRSVMQGWTLTAISNVLEIAVCCLGLAIAHRLDLKEILGELGLIAPVKRAVLFALIATLPMLITFAATSGLNPKMTFLSIGVGSFVAPFAEQVIYRGYIFRQLYRRAGWSFWPAVVIPSILFALGHVYQATGTADLIGILAITGLGSILFCWIFIRWQDNLWTVIALHLFMNLWWELFAVDDTALGGWLANGARLLTVVIAIVLTCRYSPVSSEP